MTSRAATALAALILCLHLGLGYSHNYRVGLDDDRLWLYTTGAGFTQAARSAALSDRVRTSLRDSGAGDSQVFRFDLREGYRGNYVAAAGAYHVAALAVQRAAGPAWTTDYPAYLSRAMYAGFVGMYAATVVALLAIVLATADRRAVTVVTLAIAMIAGVESLFDLMGDGWTGLPTLLPDAGTSETFVSTFVPNFPALLLNPHSQLSPFGDTPRNQFILLMVPLFLLRWQGWHLLSYVGLAGLSFLHQSHTGLVLALLVATDAVLRPSLFRGWTSVALAVTLALFIGRESLGQVIGIARPVVVAAIALGLTVIAWAIATGLRGRLTGLASRLADARHRLLARGPVFADLALIAVLLLASFPPTLAINALGSESQSVYFWSQVHGRSIGILRPAFVLGCCWLAATRLTARLGAAKATRVMLACSAAALVPSVLDAWRHDRHPVARIERQARTLDAATGPAVDWARIGTHTEPEIYYAIARTLDIGR